MADRRDSFFPQNTEIRTLRLDFKKAIRCQQLPHGHCGTYQPAIAEQKTFGTGYAGNGEAERNDVVEILGEHLDGFVFTQNE
ncbi:hypothetical protein ACLK1T_11555 [Escherichia coli]